MRAVISSICAPSVKVLLKSPAHTPIGTHCAEIAVPTSQRDEITTYLRRWSGGLTQGVCAREL